MESMGVLQQEDCEFFSKMFANDEEADFTFQFWKSFGNSADNVNANFTGFDKNLYSSSENFNNSFYHSQDNTNISTCNNYSACFPSVYPESPQFCGSNIIPVINDISKPINIFLMDEENNALANFLPNDQYMQDVATSEVGMGITGVTDIGTETNFEVLQQPETVAIVENNPKKRCRIPRDVST